MSCVNCKKAVENAVSKVNGIENFDVNLLLNELVATGDFDANEVIDNIKNAGYDAKVSSEEKNKKNDDPYTIEIKNLKLRFFVSLFFLIILMYLSMGYNMFKFPLPSFLSNYPLRISIFEMILAFIIMLVNKKYFVNGVLGIINGSSNMDTLVSLGSVTSFVYSLVILIRMFLAGENLLHDLYFESCGMILTLIDIGKILEAKAKGKTTSAINELIKLKPEKAILLDENKNENKVNIKKLKVGDFIVVYKGYKIPIDSVVVEGATSINETMLTGESVPVIKNAGDECFEGTINLENKITLKVIRIGEDTTLSKIITLVKNIGITKAPIERIADKVAKYFVPIVTTIACITFIIWMLVDHDATFAIKRAISVLVISCPCALGLATPTAIIVGSGLAAKNGILFKNAESIENTGKVDIAAFDKTGTLTTGAVGSDKLRFDSKKCIEKLKNLNIMSVMISGDKQDYVKKFADELSIDRYYAEVLPDGKSSIVDDLKKEGKVLMVGDGINDAVALANADVGVSINGATDIAINSANVILMNNKISNVVNAILISKAVIRKVKQNLFFAFIYNVLCIPIAAGVYIKSLGLTISPMLCAMCMSISSFFVVTNALLLNSIKLYEEDYMKIEVKIDGMMCPHCEKHMKEAFEKLDGVISATCSHEKKIAYLETEKDIDKNILKKTVEETGYTYLG